MIKPFSYAGSAGLVLCLLLAGCGGGRSDPTGVGALPDKASCVLESPRLEIGKGLDAPGRIELPIKAGATPAGACKGNDRFRFGSGLYDITGPAGGASMMGYESPTQVSGGIYLRQYARAFAIESPCNGKRIAFVSTDTGMIFDTVRQEVLRRLADDPELGAHYGEQNLMLSATHTHAGAAGYSVHLAFLLFHLGFDNDTFQAIVGGIVESIRLAHANLEAHPQSGRLRLSIGELLDTNLNRSKVAFDNNPEEERREYLNQRGEIIDQDKRFVQLNLVRDNGSAVGVINWFGVHPTSLGNTNQLLSGDNKGFASEGFERLMRTDYNAPPGQDNFVAAFAQTNEGDASPNIFILDRPFEERGGSSDELESTAISGTKQLAQALRQFRDGGALTGPVDYRQFTVLMDDVEVTDPVILAGLHHPPELDAPVKRTCMAAAGISFAAGAEDGPGYTTEGLDCSTPTDLLQAAADDVLALLDGKIPGQLVSNLVLCNLDQAPLLDLGCHAEKPILFPIGRPLNLLNSSLPFQIFRIGNFALVGLPWEVTTMSGRRIRQTVLDVLGPVGVDTVVIAGLANDFVNYLTTREEYATQQYEGGSTMFGPWSLAAVQQETRRLAITLRDDQPPPPPAPRQLPNLIGITLPRVPQIPLDLPLRGAFGSVVTDAAARYTQGDVVSVSFSSGHPRNDLRTQSSFVFVERQNAQGGWDIVATDTNPELRYLWNPLLPSPAPIGLPPVSSTSEAVWIIPQDTPPGLYRIRHVGAAKPLSLLTPAMPYEGISASFAVEGRAERCP